MAKFYELIIFTASMDRYAFPLMEQLDKQHYCEYVLWREYCTQLDGTFVKDLSKIGRSLEDTILLDNSPNSYFLQRNNGLPIVSWYDDAFDRELYKYIEILEVLADVPDVTHYIPKIWTGDKIDYSKAYKMVQELKLDFYNRKCHSIAVSRYLEDLKKYKSEKNLSNPLADATNDLSANINFYSYGNTYEYYSPFAKPHIFYSMKTSSQPRHKWAPSESRDFSYYKANDTLKIDMKDQISKWYTPITNKSKDVSKGNHLVKFWFLIILTF